MAARVAAAPRGSAVHWTRRACRPGGLPCRHGRGSGGGPGRRRHIDKDVDPAARGQHERAVAGLERFRRLAVEGHHPDVEISSLIAMTARWQPLMKRILIRSLVRAAISRESRPFAVKTVAASFGSTPGATAVPSGRSRQSSIREDLVAIDRDGLAFQHHQRRCPRRLRLAVAEQAEVAQECPGMAQRQLQGSLAPLASGARAVSGSATGTPSIPRQLRTAGTGSSLEKGRRGCRRA